MNYLFVKKPSFWIIIAAIVICVVVAVCFMTSPKKAVDNGVEIEYVSAVVDKDTISGADGAMIACGNDECIVFYDYYGLFVVDVINKQLKTSLDLQSIGCSATQGDEACEIFMDDGDNILIHAMNSDSMYVFNYNENTVKETEYDETQCVADKNIVDLADYLYLDYTKFQGRQAYIFNDEGAENIVWLESGSGMPIDMALHIRDDLTDKADYGGWFYIFKEGEITDEDSSVKKRVYAEGTFDNIMGYSGYYVYFYQYPTIGYYYADDGTLLAEVWGTAPEDVGMVDLNGDGKNELVSGLIYSDGANRVVVYSEFEDGIRYAFVSDTTDEKYYNSTWYGEVICEYLKDTNEVKFSYWIEEEQGYNKENTIPIDFEALAWWTPAWVDDVTTSEPYSTYTWGDQRDWLCGSISERLSSKIAITIKLFISEDDAEMREKYDLSDDDFPDGYAIIPTGDTIYYALDEDCEFIFIDWHNTFTNDSRVSQYDGAHVITKDYTVFEEYLDEYTSLGHQVFFYDIEDEKIKTVYEVDLP